MNFFRIYPERRFIYTRTTGTDFDTLLAFYKEVASGDLGLDLKSILNT